MKKFLMTIAAVFAAVNMNAQYYVGGTLGFGNNKTTGATTEVTTNGLTIAPEFGMALDEKMGVGIEIAYTSSSSETKYINGATAPTPNLKPGSSEIALRPYLRYQLFTFGKANIFVDGGVNFSIDKDTEVGVDLTGNAYDNKAGMNFGLFATPGFAFNLNESWSIVAKIQDVFTFGYRKNQVADVTGAPDAPTSLNARIDTKNKILDGIRFGIYYKF